MPQSPKKMIFRTVALLFGLTLAVGTAELLVRAFSLAPGLNRVATNLHRLSNNPELKYELVPWAVSGYEAINGQGLRDFHYPQKKEPGVFRIAVLGDSVTYGWGTNVWKTHPNMTEYFLNHFYRSDVTRFEALNFGVRGYGTQEQAECLRVRALPYNPDLVILAYNLNDPDPFSVDLTWAYANMEWADEQFLNGMRKAWNSGPRRWLYERSELFRLVKYRLLARKQVRLRAEVSRADEDKQVEHEKKFNYTDKRDRYLHEVTEAYFDRVEDGLAKMAAISAKTNIPILVVIFPALDDLENYNYVDIHRRVWTEAEKNGMYWLDLLPAFRMARKRWPALELAIDFDHPAKAGQKVAAWAIANHLIENGFVPESKELFDSALFDFTMAEKSLDLSYFKLYDMFHVEQGLNNIFFELYAQAVEDFKNALELNPENDAARAGLKIVFDNTSDKALRADIEALLN